MVWVNYWYCLTKVFKTGKKVQKKRPPFTISVLFHNKGFGYIHLSSILDSDNVKNLVPDKWKIDEPNSFVYSLGKTIRKKIINYKGLYLPLTHMAI